MTRALGAAFAFLTRLPLGMRTIADRDLGRSVAFFPLVGLAVGLVVIGLAYGLVGYLPSPMIAVLVVSVLATVTGALHLDGLADLFDGLGGGRGDRERILAIMRDSRIGAHGAVAVVLLLAAKIAAISALLEARDFLALLVFPAIARWAVAPQIIFFPYARAEGLGRAFKGEARPIELLIATATLAGAIAGLGLPLVKLAGAALAASLMIGLALRARLSGLTGDIYGATIEITEVVALFVAPLR